jgi:hypothetical protein
MHGLDRVQCHEDRQPDICFRMNARVRYNALNRCTNLTKISMNVAVEIGSREGTSGYGPSNSQSRNNCCIGWPPANLLMFVGGHIMSRVINFCPPVRNSCLKLRLVQNKHRKKHGLQSSTARMRNIDRVGISEVREICDTREHSCL